MVLLPLVERLTAYLLGIAAWCLFLGQDSRIHADLTPTGKIALAASLACIPPLLWLHRRAARHRNGGKESERTATAR